MQMCHVNTQFRLGSAIGVNAVYCVAGLRHKHLFNLVMFPNIQCKIYVASILYHSLFRFGSAIVVHQLRPIPFLTKVASNHLCFLTYSNKSTLPQDEEVPYSKYLQ